MYTYIDIDIDVWIDPISTRDQICVDHGSIT